MELDSVFITKIHHSRGRFQLTIIILNIVRVYSPVYCVIYIVFYVRSCDQTYHTSSYTCYYFTCKISSTFSYNYSGCDEIFGEVVITQKICE